MLCDRIIGIMQVIQFSLANLRGKPFTPLAISQPRKRRSSGFSGQQLPGVGAWVVSFGSPFCRPRFPTDGVDDVSPDDQTEYKSGRSHVAAGPRCSSAGCK